MKINYFNFNCINVLLTILIYINQEHEKDEKSNILINIFMVKLSTHSRNLHFSFLVTSRFTKEDDPVSFRIYSTESRKTHYFAYNHSEIFWGEDPRPPPP